MRVLMLIFSSSFLTFIFSILISGILGISSQESSDSLHEYQTFKRNYESQSTTNHGIVSIKENDDLTYDQVESVLMSNFGEKEFECFGSCFCDDEKRKTSSSSFVISKRTISYFLVSLSSILAFKKAKSYFDSKCQKELSKECHLSSIKSSVEECSPVNKEKEKEYLNEKRKDDAEQQRVYFCYGNCVYNLKHKKESTLKQFSQIQCEKLKKEGNIKIYESDLIKKAYKSPSSNFVVTAENKFQEYHLVEYCKENSRKIYIWEGTQKTIEGKIYRLHQKERGSGCVGRNSGSLKNVHCRQIDPESTAVNRKWRLDKFNREKEEWDLV